MEKKMSASVGQLSEKQAKTSRSFGDQMIALIRSISATLDMRADQTFHISAKLDGIEQVSVNGTWTLEGDRVEMVGRDGDGVETVSVGRLKADGIHFATDVGKLKGPVVFKPN